MAGVQAFDAFANNWLKGEYNSWAGRMYLHMEAAKKLRTRMDSALEDAARWTQDIAWERGEAPQHWLHRGDPVLRLFKEAACDLVALLRVKSKIGSGVHHLAVCRLAYDVVLLHSPPVSYTHLTLPPICSV